MTDRDVKHFAVLLGDSLVGFLRQRGDFVTFRFADAYLADPERPVLGLRLEERLRRPYSSALMLPPWFSNLLPEGVLREWTAQAARVSADREMELLAFVGHDLPGAVRILEVSSEAEVDTLTERLDPVHEREEERDDRLRFSLAGVALKFSVENREEKYVLPAHGLGGDWIVKLPDLRFAEVPRNEFTTMSLARHAGIDVPEFRLANRDEFQDLPDAAWRADEDVAYVIRRFDRGPNRELVHMEDFAQVRDFYPRDKYRGSYETLGALAYRGHDVDSYREVVRRLAFLVLVSSGDAHLKNWSLIYNDPRRPVLSPAYDLVSTSVYVRQHGLNMDLALRLAGSRRLEVITLRSFEKFEARIVGADVGTIDVVRDVVNAVVYDWRDIVDTCGLKVAHLQDLGGSIGARAAQLR